MSGKVCRGAFCALLLGCQGFITDPSADAPMGAVPAVETPSGMDPVVDPVTGEVIDPVTGEPVTDPETGEPVDAAETICRDAAPNVPVSPIRRLTRDEYDNTVLALFGDDSTPARAFPPDVDTEGFLVGGVANPLYVEQAATAAENVAPVAFSNLSLLSGCDNRSCADGLIADVGRMVYRRALEPEEQTALRAVFDTGDSFRRGVELVVEAMLQSPNFLYHVEVGPADASDGDVVVADDTTLATRLAYFLWASTPDAALLQAAEEGRLQTLEGLEAEAQRMLADTRALDGFRSFYRQWLKLSSFATIEKDPSVYEWSAAVARDLQASLEAQMDAAFLDNADLSTLLTSTDAYVNARIAPYFNLDPARYGSELERVGLPADQRAGILTHPTMMALFAKSNQSDPIHRAVFVREKLFCQHLPTPPDDLVIVAPDPAPGLSTRERFAEHSSNPACAGCHELLDPLGFGFEHYDGVGAYRDTDNGELVDASGEVIRSAPDLGVGSTDGVFYGGPELARRLGESREVQRCFARQLFRFATQRVETMDDACSLVAVDRDFAAGGHRLRDLMLAIVRSNGFRFLKVSR